jgi:putative transposase
MNPNVGRPATRNYMPVGLASCDYPRVRFALVHALSVIREGPRHPAAGRRRRGQATRDAVAPAGLTGIVTFAPRKYRAYPTPGQEALLRSHCDNVRAMRNVALEHRKGLWRMRSQSTNAAGQDQLLREAAHHFDWLQVTPQQVLQQTLRDLDTAYSRFFSGHAGYPTFRSRWAKQTFTVPQRATCTRTSKRWGTVTLPGAHKVGLAGDERRLRVRMHRSLGGTPTGKITYSCEPDGTWWVVVHTAAHPSREVRPSGPRTPVGIDLGVKIPVATSAGEFVGYRPLAPKEAERLRRLQRQLARQQKGSRNRAKTRLAIAKLQARARRRRVDFARQTAVSLCRAHDLVVFEDLRIAAMTRSARGTVHTPGRNVAAKSGLNRETLNVGWGQLVEQTLRVAKSHGTRVVMVDPRHTSQTCPACETIDPASRVTRSRYVCTQPGCGYTGHADTGAAINILNRGLAVIEAEEPLHGGVTAVRAEGSPVHARPRHTSVGHTDGVAETAGCGRAAGTKLTAHHQPQRAA